MWQSFLYQQYMLLDCFVIGIRRGIMYGMYILLLNEWPAVNWMIKILLTDSA